MPPAYRREEAPTQPSSVVGLQPFRAAAVAPTIAARMRSRAVVLFTVIVLVLLAGAGAVYAVDRSQSGKIAEGISIDGIDVGGMTGAEASAALREPGPGAARPDRRGQAGGKRFTLPPQRAQVEVDVDDSVRAALARSREGNVLARAWRNVRGGEVDEDLDLSITYSEVSIDRLVDRVAGKIDEDGDRRPASTSRAAT